MLQPRSQQSVRQSPAQPVVPTTGGDRQRWHATVLAPKFVCSDSMEATSSANTIGNMVSGMPITERLFFFFFAY